MEILTPQLRLTPLSWTDVDSLVELHSDPAVMFGSSGIAEARDRQESVEWLDQALSTSAAHRGRQTFRVGDRSSDAFLGRCGLRPHSRSLDPELAYAFVRRAWGGGVATEAARATLEWGAASGVTRVFGCVLASNPASQRVLEKLGMICVGEEPTPVGPLFLYERNLVVAE